MNVAVYQGAFCAFCCEKSGAFPVKLILLIFIIIVNRLALKSGIDSHPESPQVGHSRLANTAQHLNLVYVVASSD